MVTAKLTISLPGELLARIDELVRRRAFRDRSGAIESMVRQQLERMAVSDAADALPETELFGAAAYTDLHAGDWQDIEG